MEAVTGILASLFSTSLLAALLGLGLAAASRKLRVEKAAKVETLERVLPGLNCGVCGYAGCSGYAEALAAGKDEDAEKCKPGGPETLQALGELLGLAVEEGGEKMVARLRCMGGDGLAVRDYLYKGYADCESLHMLFEGDKGCKYSCLGLGSCIKVCPVDAISFTSNGLVRVDEDLCIGCEACVIACPTAVMTMIPKSARWFVACSSKDSAKVTKSLCKVGCIGCRICEKKTPNAGFSVSDNLSILKYNDNDERDCRQAANSCPPKCIIKIRDE